jgi:polysaccharide pyruvyl transferase WcaK-like protein
MYKNKNRLLVVISGYFGVSSLGDELILSAALENPNQYLKIDNSVKVDFIVITRDKKFTESHYKVKAINKLDLFSTIRIALISDILWIPGGGLFNSRNLHSYIYYLFLVLLFKFFSNKVFFTSIGIDENTFEKRINGFILKTIVKMADFFSVRDEFSYNFLNRKMNLKKVLIEDEIVNSYIKKISHNKMGKKLVERKSIGISLTRTINNSNYYNLIVEFVKMFINKNGNEAEIKY